MSSFVIEGGRPLKGSVTVAGNKNAALPMLAATLLTDEEVERDKVPAIRDVKVLLALLEDMGARLETRGPGRHAIHVQNLHKHEPSKSLCAQIRASFLLAGPLLARAGRAELP